MQNQLNATFAEGEQAALTRWGYQINKFKKIAEKILGNDEKAKIQVTLADSSRKFLVKAFGAESVFDTVEVAIDFINKQERASTEGFPVITEEEVDQLKSRFEKLVMPVFVRIDESNVKLNLPIPIINNSFKIGRTIDGYLVEFNGDIKLHTEFGSVLSALDGTLDFYRRSSDKAKKIVDNDEENIVSVSDVIKYLNEFTEYEKREFEKLGFTHGDVANNSAKLNLFVGENDYADLTIYKDNGIFTTYSEINGENDSRTHKNISEIKNYIKQLTKQSNTMAKGKVALTGRAEKLANAFRTLTMYSVRFPTGGIKEVKVGDKTYAAGSQEAAKVTYTRKWSNIRAKLEKASESSMDEMTKILKAFNSASVEEQKRTLFDTLDNAYNALNSGGSVRVKKDITSKISLDI